MKYLKNRFLLVLAFISINILSYGNSKTVFKDTIRNNSYPLILQDAPAQLSTMRQVNQNYLSAYRLFSSSLNNYTSKKKVVLVQYFSELFFLLPYTHEEGHRSILTSMNIGSISQPYFNAHGAAYVKGVSDIDLQTMRTNHLPNYIRLHTSGLESDYMISNRIEKLVSFKEDSFHNLNMSFTLRKLSLISYYTLSLIPGLSPNIEEENNELERDIVGHDVYGAIKNLHRPNERFYRYTEYGDLTYEELYFLKRVGFRALVNIASPMFFKKLNLINKPNINMSVSAGYTMCPFGDFIDQNVYVFLKNKYKIHAYLRQFQNKTTWFPAGGLSISDYKISSKFSTDMAAHIWAQPENLDFNTTKSATGGAIDLIVKYKFLNLNAGNSISLDLGLIYKTKGFLPEEVMMDKHFGLRLGCTLNLLKK